MMQSGKMKAPKGIKDKRRMSEDKATQYRALFFHIRREWYRKSQRDFMISFPRDASAGPAAAAKGAVQEAAAKGAVQKAAAKTEMPMRAPTAVERGFCSDEGTGSATGRASSSMRHGDSDRTNELFAKGWPRMYAAFHIDGPEANLIAQNKKT